MEYEDHRPLYDWFLDALDIYHPQQIEFARFNIIPHRAQQAQADYFSYEDGARGRLGRPAHAHTSPDSGDAATRRRRYASFCDEVGINRTAALTEMAPARASTSGPT